MHFLSAVLAVTVALTTVVNAAPTVSYMSGFNLGANRPQDNKCKTIDDWKKDLTTIKSWAAKNPSLPKAKFNTVKIFSTGDCNALMNAAAAARSVGGIKIWAGVWNVPDWKFGQDKGALEQAIKTYGSSWLAGVNVGSESLYRKEVSSPKLAQQIYDVKGMVQIALKAPQIAVGTADTWTSWVNPDNKPVINAVDVVLMNAFPYWQKAHIPQGLAKFREAITNTRNAVGNKPFVVGETGWPTAEDTSDPTKSMKPAVASLTNLRTYWKDTMCWLMTQNIPYFWFSGFDEPKRESVVERNFGAAWWGGTPKVEMNIKKLCGL